LARTSLRGRAGMDRLAGAIAVLLIAGVTLACAAASARALFRDLPQSFASRELQHQRMLQGYEWIRKHTPQGALVAAYDDGLLYLNTGRRGYTVPLMPDRSYETVSGDDRGYFERLQRCWRSDGMTHVLVTEYDFQRDPVPLELSRLLEPSGGFEIEYSDPTARVYRIRPQLQAESSTPDTRTGGVERGR
jgi:hypothetical protein